MPAERILVVGAGPAGLATARAYREHGGRGELTLIGEESLPPYERPPLTKDFLRGELDASELPIEAGDWFVGHGVTLELGESVSSIDRKAGTAIVQGSPRRADAIVLATGSEPIRAQLPGIDHPAVATMRTLADSVRIAELAGSRGELIVLGSGFIGCEIAASLAMLGVGVTLVGEESLPQAARLGTEVGERLAGWLRSLGVRLAMDANVCAVHDGRALELQDGERLEAEGLVLAMGARPRSELAARAGLTLAAGAVCVDAQMRVRPARAGIDLFAVGDVAFAENATAGRALRVEHWGDALAQGEIAGRVLAGEEARWASVPGFWSTIGERRLKYAAWGDGYEQARLVGHHDSGFTVWYSDAGGAVVGVLTHDCDADYERGRELIAGRAAAP